MSLVALSESGYSLSSIDLLKSCVRIGERRVLRSLIILGLILYRSLAFSGLIFRMSLVISS